MGNGCGINQTTLLDLNLQDKEGLTILIKRLMNGETQSLIQSIETFGYQNIKFELKGQNGYTFIYYVCRINNVELMTYLKSKGLICPPDIYMYITHSSMLDLLVNPNTDLSHQLILKYIEMDQCLLAGHLISHNDIVYANELNAFYQKYKHQLASFYHLKLSKKITIKLNSSKREMKLLYINYASLYHLDLKHPSIALIQNISYQICSTIYKQFFKNGQISPKTYIWLLSFCTPDSLMYKAIMFDVQKLPSDHMFKILLINNQKSIKDAQIDH